jgi:hypothetical protein
MVITMRYIVRSLSRKSLLVAIHQRRLYMPLPAKNNSMLNELKQNMQEFYQWMMSGFFYIYTLYIMGYMR